MGKVVQFPTAMVERNRLYNLGFSTAFEGDEPELGLYENNEPYRRGYDAGEETRDDMIANPGDYDDLTESERKMIYGEEDRL